MRNLRIVFMGTPDFAVGILDRMIADGLNIVGVITAPDRPAGRGRKLRQSAVKDAAMKHGLNVLQPTNLKDEGFLRTLDELSPDLQVVVAFRMLPRVVWEKPSHGTFNLHASLLPDYRGAAPINWAIINEETTTGVTTFFIDEKIDTGAVIASSRLAIDDDETAGSLHDKLMELGKDLVMETIDLIASGEVHPIAQEPGTDIKEAPKLNSENTRIDWSSPPNRIDAFIRGLNPYPAAWTLWCTKNEEIKLKVFSGAYIERSHSESVGTLVQDGRTLLVALENGFYRIDDLQLAGKRRMLSGDFLNGIQPATGDHLK